MLAEAANWGGKVLLHREVAAGPTPLKMRGGGMLGGPTPAPPRPPSRPPSRGPGGALGGTAPAVSGTGGAETLSEAAVEAAAAAAAAAQQAQQAEGEDITRTTQYQPTMQVQAFWESCGDVGDIDQARCP